MEILFIEVGEHNKNQQYNNKILDEKKYSLKKFIVWYHFTKEQEYTFYIR